jgi:hypothetical protein
MWQTIRTQLQTLLSAVSGMQEFSATPKMKFGGYPAGYVIPSNSSGDYETNTENVRVYAYLVRVFYETKSTGVGDALDKLCGVVDTILDTLDGEDLKGATSRTVGVSLPSGYTYLNIFAHPSSWEEIPGEDIIYAEIKVQVRISRDIQ